VVSRTSAAELIVFIDFMVRTGSGRIAWQGGNAEPHGVSERDRADMGRISPVRAAQGHEIVYDPPLSLRRTCSAADGPRAGRWCAVHPGYAVLLYPLSDISIITNYFSVA
jgi:hypothetical protein